MLNNNPAWEALKQTAAALRKVRLRDLFAAEPQRRDDFQLDCAGIHLDFSKQLINNTALQQLLQLAEQSPLREQINAMFRGERINRSEQRAVLHTALRDPSDRAIVVDGQDIKPLVKQELDKIKDISERIRSQKWLGSTGKPIDTVVNIGIGGSDLGPKLITQSLGDRTINCQFLAETDDDAFDEIFSNLSPETTLILIASKSFTTRETIDNATRAIEWLGGTNKIAHHCIAITARPTIASQFGIPAANHCLFWDWVGGRFSVWSAIGLPIAIAAGFDAFSDFLLGAHEMDNHFRQQMFSENLPVILALIGIWNINFLNCHTLGIIPYAYKLRSLTAYIQQLTMESNGKIFTHVGNRLPYPTAPVIWGTTGYHGQHSYFQALYQSGRKLPIDFIRINNQQLPHSDILAGLRDVSALLFETPHTIVSLEQLAAKQLGALLALYEHKITAQGFLWNINSFDQQGIEIGKSLCKPLTESTV